MLYDGILRECSSTFTLVVFLFQLLDAESFTGLGDHTRVGSPLFMAPEILLREDYGPQVVRLQRPAG